MGSQLDPQTKEAIDRLLDPYRTKQMKSKYQYQRFIPIPLEIKLKVLFLLLKDGEWADIPWMMQQTKWTRSRFVMLIKKAMQMGMVEQSQLERSYVTPPKDNVKVYFNRGHGLLPRNHRYYRLKKANIEIK